MSIISFLQPQKVIDSVKSLSKDVSNYLFYRDKIKLLESEGIFRDLNMRVDWIKRVYYVINLEPETMLATGDIRDLEKSRVFESVSRYQGSFVSLNLTEIVDVRTRRIKTADYYAYLVWIRYRIISTWGDLYNVIGASVLAYYLVRLLNYIYINVDVIQSLVTSILNRR
jgi:hypothetical protein